MKLRWLAVVSAAFTMALGTVPALAIGRVTQGDDAPHTKLAAKHRALQKVLASVDATPSQANQVFEIRERYEHAKLELAASSKEHVDLARLHSIQEEAGKAIANVFSSEQFQKLRSSGSIPILLGEDKGGNPWDFLTKLDLSQEQRIQLKKIVAKANRSIDATEQDPSLSADEVKAKLAGAHDTAISEIEAMLTPAQQQQLHKLLREQSKGRIINP